MRILALNCGSSSIKSALIDSAKGRRLLDARVTGVGAAEARLAIQTVERALPACRDIGEGASALLAALSGRLTHGPAVEAVVHRIVHGGERFRAPTLVDDHMTGALEGLGRLAPLHNPPALAALALARRAFPGVPHVAVFDTAFHGTLPRRAREYALPEGIRTRYGARRYGFHGISHAHVMTAVAARLGVVPQALRIVSCHLGNGASVAAIEYGRSVETSMGMTPLEGLVMGTRSGDVDPGLLIEVLRDLDRSALERLLNQESGLLGLTGTQDMREIEERAARGDEDCRLAISVYAHRVRKYIGAYAATMGGVDVIAFTGGVGEGSALVRHRCLQRLEFLGAVLDEDRNRDARVDGVESTAIASSSESRVKLLVVRADEECEMATQAAALLTGRTAGRADTAPRPDAPPAGRTAPRARTRPALGPRIPVAISARHAHLSQPTIERLFGPGYRLEPRAPLSQTGQFSAQETVTLVGPRARLPEVRVMGPPRDHDQVEISRSDEFVLGVDAPVRISGDLANTPGITIEGPAGRVTLASGLICARRHIHMSTDDAARFGVRDCDVVAVRLDTDGRDLVFGDVMVRVSPSFRLELHLDTDEANAAGVRAGDTAELVMATR
jgi:acetate kinase